MEPTKEKIITRIDQLLEKAQAVLHTRGIGPLGGQTLDTIKFSEWKSGAESFIVNLLGKEHIYYQNFEEVSDQHSSHVNTGIGILRAIREEVEAGYLIDVKLLISAEIFTDFLEMALHLLEAGYKDPAASLIGAVLEDGLRRISEKHGLTVKSKEDISSLNKKIADKSIINRLVQKKIQVWADIRNNADHGKFNEYKIEDVQDMQRGVNQFLIDQLE